MNALRTATKLLLKVFDEDIAAMATLITAEAEGDIAPAIHGLESLKGLCEKLLNELKIDKK